MNDMNDKVISFKVKLSVNLEKNPKLYWYCVFVSKTVYTIWQINFPFGYFHKTRYLIKTRYIYYTSMLFNIICCTGLHSYILDTITYYPL